MNILLCFNDGFCRLARTLIISLMCHHETLHFYVAYCELSDTNRQELRDLVEGQCPQGVWPWDSGVFQKQHPQRTIEFIHFLPPNEVKSLYIGNYSFDIWTRVFVWDQIPVDRLLYLDVDMVVNGSLERFYNDDLQGNLFKACPDVNAFYPSYDEFISHRKREVLFQENEYEFSYNLPYCNSGVWLFDVKALHRAGYSAQVMLERLRSIKGVLRLPDQDFLNICFQGHIKFGNPYKYNCLVCQFTHTAYNFAELNFSEAPYPKDQEPEAEATMGACFDPDKVIVLHYAGGGKHGKPYHLRYRYYGREKYWRYLALDPSLSKFSLFFRHFVQSCWILFRRDMIDFRRSRFWMRVRGLGPYAK